jgi:hypothetical protein
MTTASPPTRRPWYQFSLRTMLIVMVLASAAFGYWVHWSKEWIRQRHAIWEAEQPVIYTFNVEGQERDAPCGLWLFGEEGFTEVWCVKQEDIELAKRLFPEASAVRSIPDSPSPKGHTR